MKIAFMAHNKDPSVPWIDSDGGALTIRHFALELAKLGNEITIYVNRPPLKAEPSSHRKQKHTAQAEEEVVLEKSIVVKRIDLPAYNNSLFEKTIEAADFPEILDSLAVSHRITFTTLLQYDRILFFHPLSVMGFQCLERFGELWSALFPMLLSEEYKKYLKVTDLYVELEQLALQSVRRIFVASSDEADQLISRGIGVSKIVRIGRGVDREVFFPLIRSALPRDRSIRIVTVGAIRPSKGQLILVRMLRLLRDSGVQATLAIVGEKRRFDAKENMNYFASILMEIENLDLKSYVDFLSAVPNKDVAVILRSSDLAVFPSVAESFGKAALEAVLTGTPTIVNASVRSYLDFITPNVNALAVENTSECYADAVIRLLNDVDAYTRLSRKGAMLHDKLTWENAGIALHRALLTDWKV